MVARNLPVVLAGTLFFLASIAQVPAEEAELARFKDYTLSQKDLLAIIESRGGFYGSRYRDPSEAKRLVDEVVANELLARAARDRALDQQPDVRSAINSLLVQKLLSSAIDSEIEKNPPTEKEMREYYEGHRSDFGTPETRRTMLIQLNWTDEESRRKGEEQATSILQQAKSSPNRNLLFGNLAKTFSMHESAKRGGDLRWLTRETAAKSLPRSVAEAVFAIPQEGEVAGPVRADKCLYLLYLSSLRPAKTRGFDLCRAEIRNRLYKQKRNLLYENLLAQLKKEYDVKIHYELIPQIKIPEPEKVQGGGPPKFPVE